VPVGAGLTASPQTSGTRAASEAATRAATATAALRWRSADGSARRAAPARADLLRPPAPIPPVWPTALATGPARRFSRPARHGRDALCGSRVGSRIRHVGRWPTAPIPVNGAAGPLSFRTDVIRVPLVT